MVVRCVSAIQDLNPEIVALSEADSCYQGFRSYIVNTHQEDMLHYNIYYVYQRLLQLQ